MISYKDLTYYCLHHFENSYNVGWIDVQDDFPKVSLSQEFMAKLWEYIKFPLNVHRSSNDSVLVHYNGEKKTLGFSEIRVLSKDSLKRYAAPDLIFHYVTKYNYCPPEEFIEAVLTGPKPGSSEYIHFMSKYNEENLWGENAEIVELSEMLRKNIISHSNAYVIRILEENLEYIHILTKEGSLLNLSILNRNIALAKQLLTMGIDLNKFSGIELISALTHEEDDLIELLLARNVMFNLSSPRTNPLFIATRKGNLKAVQLLLENGVDPSIEYSNEFMRNFSVIDLAREKLIPSQK